MSQLSTLAIERVRGMWFEHPRTEVPHLVLAARSGQRVAQQVARLDASRKIDGGTACVVTALDCAVMLERQYGRSEGLMGRDFARPVVVVVSDEGVEIVELHETAPHVPRQRSKKSRESVAGEESKTVKTKKTIAPAVAAVHEVSAAFAPAPAKPKKKAKRSRADESRFGHGLYGMQTKCTVSDTREQIEELLRLRGCDRFGHVTDTELNTTTVQFRCQSRTIRFVLELPRAEAFSTRVVHGEVRRLSEDVVKRRHEKALRARWRAIWCGIKAKLVLVESGIESMEEAFLAEVVDDRTGLTMSDYLRRGELLPQLGSGSTDIVDGELLPSRRNGAAHAEAMA